MIISAMPGWFACAGEDPKNLTVYPIACWQERKHEMVVGLTPRFSAPDANGAGESPLVSAEGIPHFKNYALLPHLLAPPPGQSVGPRILR